jgi:hypothetical protein
MIPRLSSSCLTARPPLSLPYHSHAKRPGSLPMSQFIKSGPDRNNFLISQNQLMW